MRIAVLSLRHLSRSSRVWGKRFVFFSDSTMTIGALSKGRSPSLPLLRLCRQAMAIKLAFNFRFHLRYNETARNVADGPPRGHSLGHAPR